MKDKQIMFMFYGALLSNSSVMPEGILNRTSEVQKDTIKRLNTLAEMAYDKMMESFPKDEDEDEGEEDDKDNFYHKFF